MFPEASQGGDGLGLGLRHRRAGRMAGYREGVGDAAAGGGSGPWGSGVGATAKPRGVAPVTARSVRCFLFKTCLVVQCKGDRLNPWSGKIPHATKQPRPL